MYKPTSYVLFLGLWLCGCSATEMNKNSGPGGLPKIVSVEKIWDKAPHNAFTDLIRFQGKWYCTFRESDAHVYGKDGQIRVIASADGEKWESVALLAEEGVDLRDPKLSIMPDGRLMLLFGGSVYEGRTRVTTRSRVAFSKDGKRWSETHQVLAEKDWLWRVTWHGDRCYGTTCSVDPGKGKDLIVKLWTSKNGLDYELVTRLDIHDRPNETTLRFLPNGDMLALVRREAGNKHCLIGISSKPFKEWKWHESRHRIGGPNFIRLPDGSLWAAGRSYPDGYKTVLARFGAKTYEPVLTLPSGGDCSYPGMVWHDGLLWMSYYSSHEGKANIYLAKIRVNR